MDKTEEFFKNLVEKIGQVYLNEQATYFSLLEKLQNYNKYSQLLSDNIFKISISDQIPFLQMSLVVLEKQKELCEKYDLIQEDEEMEDI